MNLNQGMAERRVKDKTGETLERSSPYHADDSCDSGENREVINT